MEIEEEESPEELMDDDEVSPEEEAFMRGYKLAGNPEKEKKADEAAEDEEVNIPFEQNLEEE